MTGREQLRDTLARLGALLPEGKRFSKAAAELVADALADAIEKDAEDRFMASLEKVLSER